MEQINRIEILGTVGNCRITEVGAIRIARVSVVTEYAYKNKDGNLIIETTWHNCILQGTADGPDCFDDIRRGTRIHVKGRLRCQTYTDITGRQTEHYEIVSAFGNYQITDGANIKLQPERA